MKRRVYRNAARSRAAPTLWLIASVLPSAALHAQTDDAETLADLKACVAIERSNARLACYDGVLGRAPSPPGPAISEPAPGSAAAAGTVAGVAAASASTQTPPAAAPSAPAQTPPAAAPPQSAEPTDQTIVVVEVRLRTPSSAVFVTAAGEVYDQIDTSRGRYPEVPFEARIEAGSLGSRFLISPAGGPRIRVSLRR